MISLMCPYLPLAFQPETTLNEKKERKGKKKEKRKKEKKR